MCGCAGNCNCSTPIAIPNGTNGTNGQNGIFGGWSQRMIFDTATSASPLANKLRMNNATPSSVTEIYVNDLNADGIDIDAFLDAFDNSGAYGYLRIWKQFDSTKFWMGEVTSVTDNGADHTIGVTHTASNGTFSASDSIVISFVGNGASGVTYFTGTYTQLTTLIGSLIPGGTYILTDYETEHEVPGTGVLNINTPGYVTKTEQLKLTARDASSFYHEVESLTYPGDDILYDFADNTVLAQSRPGIIYWRKRNDIDVEAWFDIRNHIVARYELNTGSFAYVSDPVNRGQIKSNGGNIYMSVRDGASLLNFRLVDDVSWIDQALHSNANASLFSNTLPYDPSTIAYHEALTSVATNSIKIGFGVTDVLIDTCTNVSIEEGGTRITLVNSNDVKIGADVNKIILQSCGGAEIGKDARDIYIFYSNNTKIDHTSTECLLYGCQTTDVGKAHDKLMLHSCNETTIGNGGSSIMFIRGSNQNTVGNNCAGISLGNSSTNLFDQSCSDIEIYSGGHNRFAQGCNVINLIGELDNAYTGVNNGGWGLNYYSPYSQMEHNTFGTGCSNITFNILGGRGNQFGDECKNLLFTSGNYTDNWRLVGCHFCRGIQNKTFQSIIHGTSFVVPNQVTATITDADWYSQVLWFHYNAGAVSHIEMAASNSLFGAGSVNGGISFGYESPVSQSFFTPGSAAVAGSGPGAFPATDLTNANLRTNHIQCLAWMWTPEGYPLSMTITPNVATNGDSTPSLNR